MPEYVHTCVNCGFESSYHNPPPQALRSRMVPKGEWTITLQLDVEGQKTEVFTLRYTESFAAQHPKETGDLIVGKMGEVVEWGKKFKTRKTPKTEAKGEKVHA